MAKATAESILDYSQALPQQKRVIRLWAATGAAPPRRVFQQRALLIHRPLAAFVIRHRHLGKLKQRWCCLLKNKDIVALVLLAFLPLSSNKFY